jgi:hypothetical protein
MRCARNSVPNFPPSLPQSPPLSRFHLFLCSSCFISTVYSLETPPWLLDTLHTSALHSRYVLYICLSAQMSSDLPLLEGLFFSNYDSLSMATISHCFKTLSTCLPCERKWCLWEQMCLTECDVHTTLFLYAALLCERCVKRHLHISSVSVWMY